MSRSWMTESESSLAVILEAILYEDDNTLRLVMEEQEKSKNV